MCLKQSFAFACTLTLSKGCPVNSTQSPVESLATDGVDNAVVGPVIHPLLVQARLADVLQHVSPGAETNTFSPVTCRTHARTRTHTPTPTPTPTHTHTHTHTHPHACTHTHTHAHTHTHTHTHARTHTYTTSNLGLLDISVQKHFLYSIIVTKHNIELLGYNLIPVS
jgi:hypothetical protein